jgi:hypothetical protein
MHLRSRRGLFHDLGGAALCSPLLLSRASAEVTPEVFRFRPEIEPLAALIERTPRDKCAAMPVEQLNRGVSYRQFLAAVFLAGVRNVNPRPPGFALHCVFVIHSAHLLGLEAPPSSRLLPLFYALDQFKASQERDARSGGGGYTMAVLNGALPPPERAAAELHAAMDNWDAERAERAVVSLARHRSPVEACGLLWEYGARDYRNIGHKAIFVANAARTLHTIGWQHAEPVLRSLVLGLLDFGPERQVNGYAYDDQCYAGNRKRVAGTFARLDGGWARAQPDEDATLELLRAMRETSPDEACAAIAARMAKKQTAAGPVWDAVHLASAELMMRASPGGAIVGLHAVTSANALHHAWTAASDPRLRYLLLLQAVGWMAQFRAWAEARSSTLRDIRLTDMEPVAGPLDETFALIPGEADRAAARVLGLGRDPAGRRAFLDGALRLAIAKSDEVHYYKYLAALVEDVPLVSARWQPYMLAATAYYLKGPASPEPAAMKQAREALRSLA